MPAATSRIKLPTTTLAGEQDALQIMRGDWDEDGATSVHLPTDVAWALLFARGWKRAAPGGWDSPNGARYWETSEALQIALTAEVASEV